MHEKENCWKRCEYKVFPEISLEIAFNCLICEYTQIKDCIFHETSGLEDKMHSVMILARFFKSFWGKSEARQNTGLLGERFEEEAIIYQ